MSVLSSSLKRRRRSPNKMKFKAMGNHDEFLSRIKKTLYYGKFPLTERFSLPVSELAAEIYSSVQSGVSLERLSVDEASEVSRAACASPCALILALFYLERLHTTNPHYLQRASPSELFVVSMMVASKFLYDDGEEDEVFNSEWAASAGIDVKQINKYEKDFLKAIDWNVFLKDEKFWNGLRSMESQVARREGCKRGWFSYTELEALLDCVDAWSLAHTLVMVSVVCLTSYTASIMTLYGSAAIASRLPGHHLNPAYRSSLPNPIDSPVNQSNIDLNRPDKIDLNLPIDSCPNLDCLPSNRTHHQLSNDWWLAWLLQSESESTWNSTDDIDILNRHLDEIAFYGDNNVMRQNFEGAKSPQSHSTAGWFTDFFLYGKLSPDGISSKPGYLPFNLLVTQ